MNKLLKKAALIISTAVFGLIGSTSLVSAQSESLLFGQEHSYSVVFRGNGEAVTHAKLVVQNGDDKPMTEFSFEVPRVTPSEMVIYQMSLPRECIKYESQNSSRTCLEYRESNYSSGYGYYGYSNGGATYDKISYTKTGARYQFSLPKPVAPNTSSALIVAYAAKGYVSDRFGLKSFDFETLKVSSRIQAVTVAVDVDIDQQIKGKKSSVDYGTPDIAPDAVSVMSEGSSNRNLDSVVGKIGSYGAMVKTAKSLSPNESLHVKGEYASHWLRLYVGSILLAVGTILAIILGLFGAARLLKRRATQTTGSQVEESELQRVHSTARHSANAFQMQYVLASLASVVSVVGLTYGLIVASEANTYVSRTSDPIFGVLTAITIVLLYGLLLLGPAIYVAIKHGWKAFLIILLADFLWLVVALILYAALFAGVRSVDSYPTSASTEQFRGGALE